VYKNVVFDVVPWSAVLACRQPWLFAGLDLLAPAAMHTSNHPACLPCSCLQLEKAQKDPARVQLLYERALAVFPVTSDLWLQYTRYLEAELKVPGLINKVCNVQTSKVLQHSTAKRGQPVPGCAMQHVHTCKQVLYGMVDCWSAANLALHILRSFSVKLWCMCCCHCRRMRVRCATAPGLVGCGLLACEPWSAQEHPMSSMQHWQSGRWLQACR
jgi:hypothetical protein